MNPPSLTLVLYATWTLLLLIAIDVIRPTETLARRRPRKGFAVFGEDISAFSERLCRALQLARFA